MEDNCLEIEWIVENGNYTMRLDRKLLCERSSYFAAIFDSSFGNWIERRTRTLYKPNWSIEAALKLKLFLYYGKVSILHMGDTVLRELLEAANEICCFELVECYYVLLREQRITVDGLCGPLVQDFTCVLCEKTYDMANSLGRLQLSYEPKDDPNPLDYTVLHHVSVQNFQAIRTNVYRNVERALVLAFLEQPSNVSVIPVWSPVPDANSTTLKATPLQIREESCVEWDSDIDGDGESAVVPTGSTIYLDALFQDFHSLSRRKNVFCGEGHYTVVLVTKPDDTDTALVVAIDELDNGISRYRLKSTSGGLIDIKWHCRKVPAAFKHALEMYSVRYRQDLPIENTLPLFKPTGPEMALITASFDCLAKADAALQKCKLAIETPMLLQFDFEALRLGTLFHYLNQQDSLLEVLHSPTLKTQRIVFSSALSRFYIIGTSLSIKALIAYLSDNYYQLNPSTKMPINAVIEIVHNEPRG